MRPASIYCYLGNGKPPDLSEFERLFLPIGLLLERPGLSHIVALTPTGEQFPATRDEIKARLAGKRDVNLQWWFDEFLDVYCGFHTDTPDGQWRVTFGFDWVDSDKIWDLASVCVSYFSAHCAGGDAVALVVDINELPGVDWDAVVSGRQELYEVPDLLIVPRTITTPGVDAERRELPACPDHVVLGKFPIV